MAEKKYFTEEERRAAKREYMNAWIKANPEKWKEIHNKANRRWKAKNKEHIAEYNAVYNAEWRLDNKEHIAEYNAEYHQTQKGRANQLFNNYRRNDKDANRGECTLTADWIIEHIFSQPCHYCGETDWKELGCDRIDNSLPHTPDNVVPCCAECNIKKMHKPYDEFMKLIGKTA